MQDTLLKTIVKSVRDRQAPTESRTPLYVIRVAVDYHRRTTLVGINGYFPADSGAGLPVGVSFALNPINGAVSSKAGSWTRVGGTKVITNVLATMAAGSLLMASLAPVVQAGQVPRCNGKVATIVGTSDDDALIGTPEADVIVGLAGHDTISSLGGNDTVCGGGGNDIIKGGAGADFLYAGRGFDDNIDEVSGQRGNDIIFGATGPDRLFGGRGRDEVRGGDGSDLIKGGRGEDRLFGVGGEDRLIGGKGRRDRADGGPHTDVCRAERKTNCEE
jgi:Ca2+-binding RTX toxin-like protein